MSPDGSVTRWLGVLRNGDTTERDAAVEELWNRYFDRLIGLARGRLRGAPPVADGEDVALSAFESFCDRARAGGFPQLHDHNSLWRVLGTIVRRKVVNLLEKENARKRGGGRVRTEADLPPDPDGTDPGLAAAPGREPDPADAAEVAELWRRAFDLLAGDDELRRIAEWHLEDRTNEWIAAELDYSPDTIRRRLKCVYALWKREVNRG